MVFAKGSRPPKQGEKQVDMPEIANLDTESPVATVTEEKPVQKKLCIAKEDFNRFMLNVKKFKKGFRDQFRMSPSFDQVADEVCKLLKITDQILRATAVQNTIAWELDVIKKRSGRAPFLEEKVEHLAEELGFEIPKKD